MTVGGLRPYLSRMAVSSSAPAPILSIAANRRNVKIKLAWFRRYRLEANKAGLPGNRHGGGLRCFCIQEHRAPPPQANLVVWLCCPVFAASVHKTPKVMSAPAGQGFLHFLSFEPLFGVSASLRETERPKPCPGGNRT